MFKNQDGFSASFILMLLIIIGLAALAGWRVYSINKEAEKTESVSKTEVPQAKPKVVVAIGDIVCDAADKYALAPDAEHCQGDKTYELAKNLNPDAILGLGDLQYENGALEKFQSTFDKSWGQSHDIFYPSPGNHEYATAGASGYYSYFADNPPATPVELARGYYSFKVGKWHIISLNSNCSHIGGCGSDSAQVKWLEQDLKETTNQCTLAYWHHPHFTSGRYSNDTKAKDLSTTFWSKLSEHKADVVLNGHDHLYERFAAQLPDGTAEEQGMRQFTVGTGGKSLYKKQVTAANSQKLIDDHFGVLKLLLSANTYSWEFIATDGSVLDSGEQTCSM